jgi:hypothetical protein
MNLKTGILIERNTRLCVLNRLSRGTFSYIYMYVNKLFVKLNVCHDFGYVDSEI